MLKFGPWKTKYRITLLLVFALLVQLVGPVVANYVYADAGRGAEGFRVLREELEEANSVMGLSSTNNLEKYRVFIDWEFDLESHLEGKEYNYLGDFNLENPIYSQELVANDENNTLIGEYDVSTEGVIIVRIDPGLYGEYNKSVDMEELEAPEKPVDSEKPVVLEEPVDSEEPVVPEEPVDSEEPVVPEEPVDLEEPVVPEEPVDPEEPVNPEESIDSEGPVNSEESTMGVSLGLLAFSNNDIGSLNESVDEDETEKDNVESDMNNDEPDESNKIETNYSGTIIINGVISQNEEEEKHGFVLELGEVTDLEGKPYGEDKLLNPQDEFYLKLKWHLENGHNYKAGDTETFDLPQGIKIQQDIPVELIDDTNQVVANAVVTLDNKVELTFTDFVETHSNIQGHMEIISEIDEKNVEVEDGEIILKPIGEEGEIRIPTDLGDRKKTIEKKGTPNKGYNADEINWEVTINKMKNDLKNAKVTDVLPEGTEYKEESLKVTKLKTDLYGNVLGDLEEINVTEVIDGNELTIPLGNIKDAYRVEYVTTVTDDDQKTFKNNATLSDDNLNDISTDATVTINRGDPIKKSAVTGYNPKTGIINWEIQFNFNQKDLNDVTLKDTWEPKGKMHLLEDSLKFQEVTIDKNGNSHDVGDPINLPEGAELVNGKDQFEVTGISTDKAYKVTYQTKVDDRVLDGFSISNTAGFGGETSNSGAGVGTYYGSKSAGNVDYKNKTIDWTIEINHDEYPMEKISIEDTLGEGLTLVEDSIEIKVDGKLYDAKEDGEYTVLGDNPFELKFPDEFTTDKKIIITYKTKYDPNVLPTITKDKKQVKQATNKASITWTPEGKSYSITKDIEAKTELNKETEDSSWKNGSYNPDTKEITWEIIVNYRENSINNLIVKDKPQGNQKIVKDSAVVKELNIATNGSITEGNTVEDVSVINVDNNTLEVNIGKTNKAYKIQYKTSIAGLSDIQKEYINQAEVINGTESLSELEAKVGIAKAHTYGAKSGEQDGKQVHWAVTVNPGQQEVTNLRLKDTVSNNQEILADTIKVYEASVDKDGNTTKKGEPISSDRYTLTHTEGELTFIVEWEETVERAFIVEYSTLFFEKHNGEVTNNYKVTGDNIVKGGTTDGDGSVIIKQLGSGGGSGEAGYLVIDKVDTTDGGNGKLAGAEFDLIDADTEKVLKSGITDKNGQIDFGRLLFGKYKLKETKVPEGYVTPNEEQEIEINKAYKPSDNKEEFKHTVENYKPVFAIELSKTGKDNKELEGAEFTLYDSDHKEIATKTTDENGKILFEDLREAGTYYLKETEAPEGYELDDKKHEVTIGEKEQEPVKIPIANNVRVGKISVLGEKTWKDEEPTDRPESIEVKLTRKVGEKVDRNFSKNIEVKPDNEGEWVYKFEDLDQFDENGLEYNYIISEDNVSENYEPIVNGYNITNIRVGKTEVSGTKTWKDDKEADRPDSIKVNLLQNNAVIDTKEVTANDNWKYSFTDLAKYDGEGKSYNYTITEQDVPGYASEVNDYDIVNTRSEKKSIEITKGWLDDNSKDRPDSVTVYLYQNDEPFGTVNIRADNDWVYKFTDLEAYDEEGKAYTYRIEEEAVEGYETTINGFNITNLRVGKTEVTGNKEWIGGPSRKPTIELQLYRNGEKLGSPVELKDGETKYTWTNLDEFDEKGKAYTYTVEEVNVPRNYRKSISADGLTVTNRYRPPTDPGRPTDPDRPEEPKKPEDPEKPKDPEDIEDPEELDHIEIQENPQDLLIDLDGDTPQGGTNVDGEDEDDDLIIDLDDSTPKGGIDVDKPTLPKTGESSNTFFYFIGLVLISLGLIFRRRTI